MASRHQCFPIKLMVPIRSKKTGAKTAICDACKESKERSSKHFYRKQIIALQESGKGICKSCWDWRIKQKKQKENPQEDKLLEYKPPLKEKKRKEREEGLEKQPQEREEQKKEETPGA